MIDPNSLINTHTKAPFQMEMALSSIQSWSYSYLHPYPEFAFGPAQWPREKGPIPTPLPYVNTIVTESAEFVYRNGVPAFSVPDAPDVNDFLQLMITRNNLTAQYIPVAEDNGNQGAIAAKFDIDLNDADKPVRFSFLKIPQECRVWLDPHDKWNILMARIQYPYRDLYTGHWMYFREEWTADLYTKYIPLLAGSSDLSGIGALPGYRTHLGDTDEPDKWQIESQEENPLGVIPVTVLRNKSVGSNPLGEGDCWRVFRLIDRIALTMHGEDRSNQQHSEPNVVAINADLDSTGGLLPGETWSVRNDNPDVEADVKLLEPSGAARAYSVGYIDKMEDLFYNAVGMSRVNPERVTAKGNMTALALNMLYLRTIATSDRKRELLGTGGYCRLFRNVLTALVNLGGVPEVKTFRPDMDISVEWPTYFAETPQDLQATTTRTIDQIQGGILPVARGAERVARAEKVPAHEIDTMIGELPPLPPAVQHKLLTTAKNGGNGTGADMDGGQIAAAADASGSSNFSA